MLFAVPGDVDEAVDVDMDKMDEEDDVLSDHQFSRSFRVHRLFVRKD